MDSIWAIGQAWTRRKSLKGTVEMIYRIIADSSCDLTKELKEKIGAVLIPMTLNLGDKSYLDDDKLDLPAFMQSMAACVAKVGSASPSPLLFKNAFHGPHTSFAVTLSSRLSGTYESAILAKKMVEEEGAGDVHVFDSKSASAGETLIALKLHEFITQGFSKQQIISSVENFINDMKTFFVLDSIDNLLKNGRLNKIVGKIISVLHIKPVMGADGNGNIALFSHTRGRNQIVGKLLEQIDKCGKKTDGLRLVIAHCNNLNLADKLKASLEAAYHFKEVLIVPTKGLSSVYADDKGIIIAF
jgi:DegV family protein with EDD domain